MAHSVSKEKDALIKRLYKSGMTPKAISEAAGISIKTVYKVTAEIGGTLNDGQLETKSAPDNFEERWNEARAAVKRKYGWK